MLKIACDSWCPNPSSIVSCFRPSLLLLSDCMSRILPCIVTSQKYSSRGAAAPGFPLFNNCFPSKERPGRSFKSQSLRGVAHSREVLNYKFASLGGWGHSLHFIHTQIQAFPIVVSRHIDATYKEIKKYKEKGISQKSI